jgi:hypothetical protein
MVPSGKLAQKQQTMTYPHKEDAAFIRLHALVQKGYRADLGVKDSPGLIRLEHPGGASIGAPSLLLRPDGIIIASDNLLPLNKGDGEPDWIYVDSEVDWLNFQKFLSGIPQPTVWQAVNAMTIWETRMVLITVTLCAIAAFVGSLVIKLLYGPPFPH